jgi:hypothetical protein
MLDSWRNSCLLLGERAGKPHRYWYLACSLLQAHGKAGLLLLQLRDEHAVAALLPVRAL